MIDPIGQRQLSLGPAEWFRPEPETPPGNQVVVKAGFTFRSGFDVIDAFTGGDQTSAGFASVSGAGLKRFDLVYINAAGAVTILQGTETAAASPIYTGAPGFTGGPNLPDQIVPVAWVEVDEAGAVTINSADITQITGLIHLSHGLQGHLVDKALLGGAPAAGVSDVVTALFVGETSGGSTTVRGVVTSPPLNYVHLLDQNKDEIIHAATASRVYGRLTEAAGVWTLSYFHTSAGGAETAVADMSADSTLAAGLTDVQLAGAPKVFSVNDPARPLFDSNVARLSDQIAGDIPTATPTVAGKVLAGPNAPGVPQAGAMNVIQNGGAPLTGGPFHTLNFSSGAAAGAAGVANITSGSGPPGPNGPNGPPGPNGPNGPTGPTGPGFTSQGPFQLGPNHTGGVAASTDVFNFGFTVAFFMVCLSRVRCDGGVANAGDHNITSATSAAAAVTVGYNTPAPGAFIDMAIGCSAAG